MKAFYILGWCAMEKKLDIELAGLTDEELLELFNVVEEHRAYLDSSVLVIEEDKEEENEDESAK